MQNVFQIARFGRNLLSRNALVTAALALAVSFSAPQASPKTQKPVKARTAVSTPQPSCEKVGAQDCLAHALDAMGGQERLESVKSFSFESVGHTALVEQSYRQNPFITSYERVKAKVDLDGGRIHIESHLVWPESDPGQAEADSTTVVGPEGGVQRTPKGDAPCGLPTIDFAHDIFQLGPLRLLLTALHASDLHFAPSVVIRSTPHIALAFTLQGTPVQIMLNSFNYLPDAVDTISRFQDHWFQWGDVHRRIYFENWQDFHGIILPTNQVEERNGILWHSSQMINLQLNTPLNEADFKMDAKIAHLSAQSKGWDHPFAGKPAIELAPNVTLFPGAWNTTFIKQSDGVIILETPISGTYTSGIIDAARKRYPNLPIKSVLSTSDSWPHIGGVRQAVASGLPVYILDLNRPLLDRLILAPHHLYPDLLARAPKKPIWRIVSGKTELGTGPNRIILFPLRGASTERQYMVYFPEHKLLYASDTLAPNGDGSLYDPELMREVIQAAKREKLDITTVYSMHQGPISWSQVVSLVEKAST